MINLKISDIDFERKTIHIRQSKYKKDCIVPLSEVNLHSLRHAYATHLLEEGLKIVTLKDLLGHAEITTTMIYLYVAQCPLINPHSPLDTLYGNRK